jgi:hypothetical protein
VSKKDDWRTAAAGRVATKPVKVFVVGLSKTGTSTLHQMLSTLGYRVCGPRKDLLARVRAGEISCVNGVLDEYDAFEDWPWPLTYKHVHEQLGPGAKFVLSLRSSTDKWLASVTEHALRTDPTKSMRLSYRYYRPFGREDEIREMYERHNEDVRRYFRPHPNQLLEFSLEKGDGWDKLCGFLGEDAPSLPVPHANRTGNQKKLNVMLNRMIAPFYARLK